MATVTTWQRRIMATGVVAATVLTPVWSSIPASAASLCAPPADTVAPLVSSLTANRTSVSLSSGSRAVTFTAHATDTSGDGSPSGVNRMALYVSGAGQNAAVPMGLVSGTTVDGTWQGTLAIPAVGHAGTWTVGDLALSDAAGNVQDYSNGGGAATSPTDIQLQSGWDISITVTGTSTVPPPTQVKAGMLTSFGLSPQSVNTTRAAKRVRVVATFGSPQPRRVNVFLSNSSRPDRAVDLSRSLTRQTGGRWVGHVVVPRWLGHSTVRAQVVALYASNVRPRVRFLSSERLQARHFPTRLAITSGTDKTMPVLKTLTFSPPTVNTVSGAQTVTITATASDPQSGVRHVDASLFIANGGGGSPAGLYPFPGIGFERTGSENVSLTRSGDKWVGTVRFRQCVPSGSWRVSAMVFDGANHVAYYGAKRLTAAGLPSTLSVTSTPGDVEAPFVRDATADAAHKTVTLDFSEGVRNVNTATLSVFANRPAATRYQGPTPVTGIVCSNGSTTVDCSGSGGLITSAVLTAPALTVGAEYFVYANLNAVTTQLTDGAGNPMAWSYFAADVIGS